jgi:two-component system, cell cycle response regulator DivK
MSKTILIVEDNPLNMKLFNDILQGNGYKTVQSSTGKDTLELAKKHKPDLIIMDIQLPEMSGLERTKMLKADDNLKDIPVLAVTAFSLEGGIEKILESGCCDALGKPIDIPSFLKTVAMYVS